MIAFLVTKRLKQKFLGRNFFNFNMISSKYYMNYSQQSLLLGNPPRRTPINRRTPKYKKTPFFDREMHKLDFIDWLLDLEE